MNFIECPLCNSNNATEKASVHDRLLGIDGGFNLVKCRNCGLFYLNPQPTPFELNRYYPDSYDPYISALPNKMSFLSHMSLNYGLKKRYREVLRHKKLGCLLEIGCANGLFLDFAKRHGNWEQILGVEISSTASRHAREDFKLDVITGTLEEAKLPNNSIDVVVMWDVIEHLHNPKSTLFEIRRILKEDGVLLIRLPLVGSWESKIFRQYWAGWDAPRHLVTFSLQTLDMILTMTGFSIKRVACISGSYLSFTLSLRFWAREKLNPSGQKWFRRIIESLPVRILVGPFFYCIDRLGKSTNVTVAAYPNNE